MFGCLTFVTFLVPLGASNMVEMLKPMDRCSVCSLKKYQDTLKILSAHPRYAWFRVGQHRARPIVFGVRIGLFCGLWEYVWFQLPIFPFLPLRAVDAEAFFVFLKNSGLVGVFLDTVRARSPASVFTGLTALGQMCGGWHCCGHGNDAANRNSRKVRNRWNRRQRRDLGVLLQLLHTRPVCSWNQSQRRS